MTNIDTEREAIDVTDKMVGAAMDAYWKSTKRDIDCLGFREAIRAAIKEGRYVRR